VHLTYLAIVVSLSASLSLSLSWLVAAPVFAGPAAAGPAKPEQARIQARIQSYLESHDVPSAAELRGLSPSAEKTLIAIASDGHADRLTRARAVAALRLLPSATVQAFLIKLIQGQATTTDATLRLLLRRAAISLGWLAEADAPEVLAWLFDNEDVEVRVDAVLGISMSRAPTAVETLRKQLAVDPSPRVRQQIERQLVALRAEPPEPEQPPAKKQQPTSPTREPLRGGF
jgi:hypothetical protein